LFFCWIIFTNRGKRTSLAQKAFAPLAGYFFAETLAEPLISASMPNKMAPAAKFLSYLFRRLSIAFSYRKTRTGIEVSWFFGWFPGSISPSIAGEVTVVLLSAEGEKRNAALG
jgi:hypothetical protein